MQTTFAIEVDRVSKTYLSKRDQVEALNPVSFRVQSGEFVSLVGSSGCGKSTVLSLIAGLIPATSGEIRLWGERVTRPPRGIGYMLQQDCLLDWRTVKKNILLGLEFQGLKNRKTIAHARFLLRELGLAHTSEQYPSQLSGGMRQRVALVRTLALQPDILLLDEPFSALDYQNKLHLEELLINVLKKRRMTALLVTHDLEEALACSDRILIMGGQPGDIRRSLEVPEELRKAKPLHARGLPSFRPLFNEIWKEIEKP
ncbi:ABC transporter ATP-binding protein [Paludifilum halophilum]|uniref:Spermidine/putrescine ABC transporter ATP-binding protein n=1 Tax=Paludifilum halophilum TaxID=1642702 RepID=A0A235B7J5_9BACL|nr:ABC transporter ATP-binding protein [Paludifilum halophilum]OYD08283.1 spermidine/putrescine ABC transporter ATP-binding protein [Paludifilum halophilum]